MAAGAPARAPETDDAAWWADECGSGAGRGPQSAALDSPLLRRCIVRRPRAGNDEDDSEERH